LRPTSLLILLESTQRVLLSMAPPTHSESHPGSAKPNSRSWTSRPTTPLRPSSRSSMRGSLHSANNAENAFPLKRLEPAFAELSDAMADLEANMMHFQLIDESLARFGESFASFLYGLNMNAFCVDFPEVLLLLLEFQSYKT
jgi:DASH complex subunit DAM1